MKIRKIAAIILSCSMILGQAVYAEDLQGDDIIIEEGIDLSEEKADILGSGPEYKDEEDTKEVKEENEEIIENILQDSAQYTQEENIDILPEQSDELEPQIQSNGQELKLYVNYDRIIKVDTGDFMDSYPESAYQAEVQDSSICSVEISSKSGKNLSVKFHLLKPGNTTVKISGKDEKNKSFSISYAVTADKLPEDAVPFKDIILRSKMLEDYTLYDANGDGYVSIDEFKQVKSLDLSYQGITDLSGLEYAAALEGIVLNDNSELRDITPLYQLQNLRYCDIRSTGVTDEERWNLADFKDFEMNKGEKIELPEKYRIAETNKEVSDFSVEILENEDLVKMEDVRSYEGIVYLTALEPGKVRLKISYKTFSTEITITIHGLHSAQEVGEDYLAPVDVAEGLSDREGGRLNSAILKSNGELWETYPEVKKVKSNVKKYVADWIYKGNGYRDSVSVKYMLDFNDTLWNGEEELASDVKKFDAHYALDSQGVLKDLYNKDTEPLHDVADWIVVANGSNPVWVYVLKEDGSLWGRQEMPAEKKSNSFTQLAEGIAEVSADGFLSLDGSLYRYNNLEQPVASGVQKIGILPKGTEYIGRFCSYYGTDGCFYVIDSTTWNGNGYDYCRVGEIDVQDYKNSYKYDETGYYEEWIILSKTGELYKYNVNEGLIKLDSDVKEFNIVDLKVTMYKKNDGSCYTFDQEKTELSMENPYIIEQLRYYKKGNLLNALDLVNVGDKDNNVVVRNGVAILDHVVKIWSDNNQQFALRTDGTIWNITEVPTLILDLATSTYVKGDVNEDGYVNIEDLRLILRGVCGKIELTERQVMIADVESDGSVDIQDLRKILRFVCGKITEL